MRTVSESSLTVGVDVVDAFPTLRFWFQIAGVLSKGIDCVRFEFQIQIMKIDKINFLKLSFFIVFDLAFMICKMAKPFECIFMYLKI